MWACCSLCAMALALIFLFPIELADAGSACLRACRLGREGGEKETWPTWNEMWILRPAGSMSMTADRYGVTSCTRQCILPVSGVSLLPVSP